MMNIDMKNGTAKRVGVSQDCRRRLRRITTHSTLLFCVFHLKYLGNHFRYVSQITITIV